MDKLPGVTVTQASSLFLPAIVEARQTPPVSQAVAIVNHQAQSIPKTALLVVTGVIVNPQAQVMQQENPPVQGLRIAGPQAQHTPKVALLVVTKTIVKQDIRGENPPALGLRIANPRAQGIWAVMEAAFILAAGTAIVNRAVSPQAQSIPKSQAAPKLQGIAFWTVSIEAQAVMITAPGVHQATKFADRQIPLRGRIARVVRSVLSQIPIRAQVARSVLCQILIHGRQVRTSISPSLRNPYRVPRRVL